MISVYLLLDWDLAVALWLRPRVGQLVGAYRASHRPMATAVSLNS